MGTKLTIKIQPRALKKPKSPNDWRMRIKSEATRRPPITQLKKKLSYLVKLLKISRNSIRIASERNSRLNFVWITELDPDTMHRRLELWKAVVLLIIISFATGPALAWTEKSVLAIANDAANLMPDNFKWVIKKYRSAFLKGNQQLPGSLGPDELVKTILDEAAGAVDLIVGQNGYSQAARKFGWISRLITELNSPLNITGVPVNKFWRTDFDIFLQKNQKDFRVRWYGIKARPRSASQLKDLLTSNSTRIKKVAGILTKTLQKDGKPLSSYDVMSVPFGIGSISYSNAVSNTAMSWLYIWDQAGGVKKESKPSKQPVKPSKKSG